MTGGQADPAGGSGLVGEPVPIAALGPASTVVAMEGTIAGGSKDRVIVVAEGW